MAMNTTSTFAFSPEQRSIPPGSDRMLLVADIAGSLNEDRLCAAVKQVLSAHSVLNAAIDHVPGYRGQRLRYLGRAADLRWQSVDLADMKPEQIREWFDAFNREPLAMGNGELVSGCVARIARERWQLALSVNSLVADRQGLVTLFDQIAGVYFETSTVELEDVFQYASFVEWRLELRQAGDSLEGIAYWDQYVARAKAFERTPTLQGHAMPTGGSAPRICVHERLEQGLVARVSNAAVALGASPEAFLQAAWWLLLARLNGSMPFVGGWQHDCRRDYEPMRGSLGVFDKVLPFAVQIEETASFAQWVQEVERVQSEHIDVQELWLVEAPPTDQHLALGYVFCDRPQQHQGKQGKWSIGRLPAPVNCFELALQVSWSLEAADLSLHASEMRHSKPSIERLLIQLEALLTLVAEDPSAQVGSLPLVGAKEHALLLQQSESALDIGTQTVADHVAKWARMTPDAPALQSADRSLSYGELELHVCRLASWLTSQGIAAGDRVAIELTRSVDLPLAMLAIWRVGAAYVPLEPAWPEARREAVLADAQPALVISGMPAEYEAATVDSSHARSGLGDLAYVLYTSGSTGTPKGVAIEHGQLLNYVASSSKAMGLGDCRRWALTSSVAADLGNTALFGALYSGSCLVIAGEEEMSDAEAFARFLRTREIEGVKIVPSHLEALLECDSPKIPRMVVLGGEAAPRSLVEKMHRLAPECAVYNHYGPTETTVGVMVHAVAGSGAVPEQLPLSQVLANNRVYVLDPNMCLVPAGCMGEVFIGGAQLCRGYLNRDDTSVFVPDPFNAGQRLYRTGDLAYVLPEGGIRLAGRRDHQVKIRGFRVEPAEVEIALLALPGVRQAVVFGTETAVGAMSLAAFCVSEAGLTAAQIRDQLRILLPEYMIPSSVNLLDGFTRLPNGKIDRHALTTQASFVVARPGAEEIGSSLERMLCKTMGSVLGRDSMGLDEDFFEAGGHSLLVIKVVARIRKALHIEVSAGLVFDCATPRSLGQALRELSPDSDQLEALAKSHAEALLASIPQETSRQQEELVA